MLTRPEHPVAGHDSADTRQLRTTALA